MELSIEMNKLEEVRKDMEMVQLLCTKVRPFLLLLKNPIIHSYQKLSILEKIFENKIEEISLKFIDIVTRKSRENVLPEIADEFLVEYRRYRKIEIVQVTTSVELDKEMKTEFENLAKKYVGKDWKVQLVTRTNEEIIGGYIVKIGDRQIDDSVSSKLRDVKRQLIVS
jgi:F-type H+-transporting ATPase subunit delta